MVGGRDVMIKKSSLAPMLRMAGTLDSTACHYVGVQVPPGKLPAFYRSSSLSLIQSMDFNPMAVRHFVSFGHLQDCLRASADNLEISVDATGIVCIQSIDGPYKNFLHVHTVREGSTGNKYHTLGDTGKQRLEPAAFSNLDVEAFNLTQQPSLLDGVLFLVTHAGVVKWQVPEALKKVTFQPRKSFLKFICAGTPEALSISENGYWVGQRDNVVGAFSSHTMDDPMRRVFNVPGTVITTIDAGRLVNALRSTLVLCEKSDRVEISADKGVMCRDKYGNEATFSLGPQPTAWGKFTVTGLVAELLAVSLAQSSEKEAAIQNITPNAGSPAMRVSRGVFEVDFRTLI